MLFNRISRIHVGHGVTVLCARCRNRGDGEAAANSGADATAADLRLFKVMGLYPVLTGGPAGRYRAVFLAILRVGVVLMSVQLVGLYYALGDFQHFVYMAVLVFYGFMCLSKGYVLLYNADRALSTLDAAKYAFTTFGGRGGRGPLLRCARTLSPLLRGFTVVSYLTLTVWLLVPYFMDGGTTIAGADDGEAATHRYWTSTPNLWVPVPESEYRGRATVRVVVSLIDWYMDTLNVLCWTMFDCYLGTMCYVLNAQFHGLAIGYESIGRRRRRHESSSSG